MKRLEKKSVIQRACISAKNLARGQSCFAYKSIQLLSYGTAFISIFVISLFSFASYSFAGEGRPEKLDAENEVEVVVGGRVFPLREGWVGAWPVKALEKNGTVELESSDDQRFQLSKTEYIPAIESNTEIKVKDKVIVTRPEMLGVWEVQYLGLDGRISVLDVNREPYTLLRNEYIPTVLKFDEIHSHENVVSKRMDLGGVYPIIALGSEGSVLIGSSDGSEILLQDGEYAREVRTAGGAKSLSTFFRRNLNSSTEPTRWIPAGAGHIRRSEPLMLETQTSFLGVKRLGAKAWVYPIEAKGENVEVVFCTDVHDATKFRNSLTSYEVPLKWLSASIEAVTEVELNQEMKLDRASLKPHFEATIPRRMNGAAAVLKFFKERAGVNPSAPCVGTMSSIPVSPSQP